MINKECWLESDLYMFQGEQESRIKEFFDSVALFYLCRDIERKGLSLCVG